MSRELINPTECYTAAERKASDYFEVLSSQVAQNQFIPILTNDFNSWKQHHIHQPSFLSSFSRKKKKPDSKGYQNYIRWLNVTNKLEPYLDRSISYLFMRDLGKDLNSEETKKRINQVVADLKEKLTQNDNESSDEFSMAQLYRKAEEDGIPTTFIWLTEKLKTVSSYIPEEMDAAQAQRKLIKIIAGVLMHVKEEMGEDTPQKERTRRLDEAIRLGYSYGLTYPFIDDLLDAKVLSSHEQVQYTDLIRRTLTTGIVPELGVWNGKNKELITFIHRELREAFQYIKAHQPQDRRKSFFEEAYVFFQSQEVDRQKDLSNDGYSNEELYIPVILKSFSSRSIIRSVINAPEDDGFESRTFYYGIYNQLADDFADIFDDKRDGAVTPYTYYWRYHEQRSDLINPFQLYWAVISHLIHNVYQSDSKTREVILNRAINGLKRFKEKNGPKQYDEIMGLLTADMPEFNALIQKMVEKADDVDFFDKLLRDHMLTNLKNEQKERDAFSDKVESLRHQLNGLLPIELEKDDPLLDETIVEAANYSLSGEGKRLRPVMAWLMAVDHYELNENVGYSVIKVIGIHAHSLINSR